MTLPMYAYPLKIFTDTHLGGSWGVIREQILTAILINVPKFLKLHCPRVGGSQTRLRHTHTEDVSSQKHFLHRALRSFFQADFVQCTFFPLSPHFGSWLTWHHTSFENIDVPCIIKPQIISISEAALVVSLKGKREKERGEACNMLEIQSYWWKALIAQPSPLSQALHLTRPHLICLWQLRVYLHCTEGPKNKKKSLCWAFTISFLFSYYFLMLK